MQIPGPHPQTTAAEYRVWVSPGTYIFNKLHH